MAKKAKRTSSRVSSRRKGVDQAFLKRYCNLEHDRDDQRDHEYMTFGLRWGAPAIRVRVDYSRETGPVGAQGHTGSCVGWAVAHGLRRWLYRKATGRRKNFSVRFVWMGSKEYDPYDLNVPFDLAGTRIRDAFKIMRKFGATPDTYWPFAKQLPNPNVEDTLKREALKYRIGRYHRLLNNNARCIHLARKGPFVIGVPVYSNWSTIGSDGVVPNPGGVFNGGHAVLVVGYDNRTQRFKFQNSWGTGFGTRGYGYFTYGWVARHSWTSWGADR